MELPLDVIEDYNRPRKAFHSEAIYNHLLKSILSYGIKEPIKIVEIKEGRFLIIDGSRRFVCAKELKFEKVPFHIYPKISIA